MHNQLKKTYKYHKNKDFNLARKRYFKKYNTMYIDFFMYF